MDRGWYGRFLLIAAVCGIAAYTLYPSYYYYYQATPAEQLDHDAFCGALPVGMHCKKFNLGLDLQGGVHLVMGVRVDKAVEQRVDRLAAALRDGLAEAKIAYGSVERPKDSTELQVTLAADAAAGAIEHHVRENFPVLEVVGQDGQRLTLGLLADEAQYVRDTAVEQAIKTIRNRADKLGVTEPTIARRGSDNILIQLPGEKDPERAINVIGRTAQLEFVIVDEPGTAAFTALDDDALPAGVQKQSYTFAGPEGPIEEIYFELPEGQKEAMVQLLAPTVTASRRLAFGPAYLASGAEKAGFLRTYLLYAESGITGDYLTDAQVQQNPDLPSDYYVTMTFDAKGAERFERLTEANVQRHMAIVLDDTVSSAPVIQEKIGGGTARITLGSGAGSAQSKFQEAKDLALVLKAGALPAPVEIREKRQVGQSLGAESVRAGSMAIAVGALLVVLFMVFYYRGSGVVADVALLLNVVLVLAVLALFEATLTLPGMAGIVLTIGMAVDANVIIFERIKEELGVGKTPRAAIAAGYSKAFSTILDANITTLIAGIVLMQYGSGPVRGFAVTLIIGILCSMFTAIVVTRLIYDFFSSRRRLQALSI